MSNKIKIEIQGEPYEIDVDLAIARSMDLAKKLGVLKQHITKIDVGDVYEYHGSNVRVCFIRTGYQDFKEAKRFRIIGTYGLDHYSDSEFEGTGATEQQVIEWIHKNKLHYVGNINESVNQLINKLNN